MQNKSSLLTLTYILTAALNSTYIDVASAAQKVSESETPTLVLASGAHLHMLAPQFEDFWQSTKNLTINQQVAVWKREIEPTFPGYYKQRFDDWSEAGIQPTQALRNHLRKYSEIHDRYMKMTQELVPQLNESLNQFVKLFPAMRTNFDIYAIHGLGGIDGGMRMIGDSTYFILGIDQMAQNQSLDNERPFLDHELFHVYHEQHFRPDQSEGAVVWSRLWMEGLATYVAERMNPKSTPGQLLLDTPTQLIDLCEANIQPLWRYLNDHLDSKNTDAYDALFLIAGHNQAVPPRAGYYLGYKIAKELGQKYTLDQMARLSIHQVRNLIGAIVEDHLRPAARPPKSGRSMFASVLAEPVVTPQPAN